MIERMEFLDFYGNKLIFTLVLFGFIIITRTIVFNAINRIASKWERLHTRTTLVKKFINYLFVFLLIVFLPLLWGFQPKDVGLFLSSIFAVIGIAFFAQWSILSNITSGIIMFFSFPYKIGDFIKIHDGEENSIYGYIEDIRAFQIIIRDLENKITTFPNSMMLQKGVSILKEENIENLKRKLEKKEEDEKKEESKTSEESTTS